MAFRQTKNVEIHDSKVFMEMPSAIKKIKRAQNKIIKYIAERILMQSDMSSVTSNHLVSNKCNLHKTYFWSLCLNLDH